MNDDFFDDEPMYSEITTKGKGGRSPNSAGAIASVILGGGSLLLIWLSIFVFFFSLIFIVLNVVGIMLAVSARKQSHMGGHSSGLATLGLVLNIISLILYSITFIACTACAACAITLL